MDAGNYEMALEQFNEQQLLDFIRKNQAVVHHKFWHGLTSLHKLCLRRELSIDAINLAVSLGADINAGNNFLETPIMFAAKRGNTMLIKLLLSKGADLNAKDKVGRTIMHHAVMGGSIFAVHFLHFVFGFPYDIEDDRKQNTLHLAVSQGNLDMVCYLLKYNRVDPHKKDIFGNTSVHTAATYGLSRLIWELLFRCNLNVLTISNEKGQTPIAICQAKESRYPDTTSILALAEQDRMHGVQQLSKPWGLWGWYLIMPGFLFTLGSLISTAVQYGFRSYFGSLAMLPFMIWTLNLFRIHTHRIKHISRLPNPMQAGSFGGGFSLTLLSWLFVMLPALTSHRLLIAAALLIVTPALYLYQWLLRSDPGFVPIYDPNADPNIKTSLERHENGQLFCPYCEKMTAPSMKHCRLCERCVLDMDHHCLFLMRCVAQNSHRRFVLFVFIVVLCIFLFLYSSYVYFSQLYNTESLFILVDNLIKYHPHFFYLIMLNVVSTLWGMSLLNWQIKYISSGMTYYSSLTSFDKMNSQITLKERLKNLLYFARGYKVKYPKTVQYA